MREKLRFVQATEAMPTAASRCSRIAYMFALARCSGDEYHAQLLSDSLRIRWCQAGCPCNRGRPDTDRPTSGIRQLSRNQPLLPTSCRRHPNSQARYEGGQRIHRGRSHVRHGSKFKPSTLSRIAASNKEDDVEECEHPIFLQPCATREIRVGLDTRVKCFMVQEELVPTRRLFGSAPFLS